MEGKLLLSRSTVPPVNFNHPYLHPLGVPLVRPNTPVAPYGTPSNRNPSFIDPTVHIVNGSHVIINNRAFVGPFVTLDARSGFIKIGNGSSVLDNAVIQSNPNGVKNPTRSVIIGDSVSIGFGATVRGPSRISDLRHESGDADRAERDDRRRHDRARRDRRGAGPRWPRRHGADGL